MGSECGVRLRENLEACVTYPCIASALIPLPKLTQSSLLLFSQIREFLDLGLVESVDNWVLTCNNVYPLDLGSVSKM